MLKKRVVGAVSVGLSLTMLLSTSALAYSGSGNNGGNNGYSNSFGGGNNGNNQNNGNNGNSNNQNNGNSASISNQNSGNTSSSSSSSSSSTLNSHAQYMVNQGIMKGDGSGNYALSDYVTRGACTVMIVRAFNLAASSNVSNFSDISQDSYYYDAAQTCRTLGIAKGDGQNFNGESYVTIEQAIALIERAAESAEISLDDIDLTSLFDSSALSSYATRQDIADMLYYVLTGDVNDEGTTEGGSFNNGNTGFMNGSPWSTDTLTSISYSCDDTVTFDGDDFADVLAGASDSDLSYIVFTTLPTSSQGVLYDGDDDAVTTSTEYDADDISDLYFDSSSSYSGTVTIRYTAYDEDAASYTGTVTITVDANDSLDEISYTITGDDDGIASFDSDDFSDVLADVSDSDLSYIVFTSLPASSKGVLYDGDDDAVTTSTEYDADDISDLYFDKATSFTGSVTISYTAYDEDDEAYAGTIKITVNTVLDEIAYTVDSGDTLTFDEDDFSDVLADLDSDDLSYIKFTSLPSSSKGVLYDGDDDAVTTSTKYYASDLSDLYFDSSSSYSGTVTLSYVAYDTDGDSYTGTVVITVD